MIGRNWSAEVHQPPSDAAPTTPELGMQLRCAIKNRLRSNEPAEQPGHYCRVTLAGVW